jgi:hypothetical protein
VAHQDRSARSALSAICGSTRRWRASRARPHARRRAVAPYLRVDRVRVRHKLLDGGRRAEVRLVSVHGDDAPLHVGLTSAACEIVHAACREEASAAR